MRLGLVARGARRHRATLGGCRVVWLEMGPLDGEPWVLLHGLGSSAVSWSPVLRALRGECRLLVPELSPLGGTRGRRGALDISEGAAAVARLVDLRVAAPVTLAGISLGGWMAVRLALDRPDLVARLLLVDAGGWADQDWDRVRALVDIQDLPGVDRFFAALFVRTPWLFRASRREMVRLYRSPQVAGLVARLGEEDVYDAAALAALRVPTAVLWGAEDGLFPPVTGRALAAAIPGATFEVLAECGHAVHRDCPRALVAAVERFRARAPLPRPASGVRVEASADERNTPCPRAPPST